MRDGEDDGKNLELRVVSKKKTEKAGERVIEKSWCTFLERAEDEKRRRQVYIGFLAECLPLCLKLSCWKGLQFIPVLVPLFPLPPLRSIHIASQDPSRFLNNNSSLYRDSEWRHCDWYRNSSHYFLSHVASLLHADPVSGCWIPLLLVPWFHLSPHNHRWTSQNNSLYETTNVQNPSQLLNLFNALYK